MTMSAIFCFWTIKSGSAVEIAWMRLMRTFIACGGTAASMRDDSTASIIQRLKCLRNCDAVFCATLFQVIIYKPLLLGSTSSVVYWVQGLVAEESFLKRKSIVKYAALRCLEALAFWLADAYVFVSPKMVDYYGERFPFCMSRPRVVAPCISDLTFREVTRPRNSYCFLGGMSEWQRFDLVVAIMNRIVQIEPRARFSVATKEINACHDILKLSATPELLARTTVTTLTTKRDTEVFLSSHEFGFLIRDDIPVNQVASPIKLAEYLSCGVNVISTNALQSFAAALASAGYLIDAHHYAQENYLVKPFQFRGHAVALAAHQKHFSNESLRKQMSKFLSELKAARRTST